MNADGIKLLFEYNYWADQRILNAASRIQEDEFTAPAPAGISYGSLRGTLTHLVDAQNLWLNLFTGRFSDHAAQADYDAIELKEADFPTVKALEERWQADKQKMLAYANTLTDELVAGTLRYMLASGTMRERVLWHCLYHFVNHATQHRGEAAVLLTTYGQSPGDVDFTLFLNERAKLPD